MSQLQEFMMIFRYQPTSDYKPTAEEQAEISKNWGAYIGNLAVQEKLVSTHQLGSETVQVFADGSSNSEAFIQERLLVGGNLVVKANSMAEATEIAKGSPILQMGGHVEVRSTIPMSN